MPNCLRLLTLAWLHALPYLLFLERKKIFQGRLFDGKKNLCIGYRPTKPMENSPARCRMTVNNINKNTSTKTLQTERETGLKLSEKPTGFLVRALQICKRATLEMWKGHSWRATVALLQARLGPFRPVFGPNYASTKFKLLIVNTLKASPKIAHLRQTGRSSRISQYERPKMNK